MRMPGFLLSLLLCLTALATACGSKSGNHDAINQGEGNHDHPQTSNRVNWGEVPSEFNPTVADVAFSTDGIERFKMNVFGFQSDVEVIYSQDIAPKSGKLRVFTVWKEMASWGELKPKLMGKNVEIEAYGQYQCSIRIQNGKIVALEGGCYVRLQVFLPVGSNVEVYNADILISKRFIPMDNDTFLKKFAEATWSKEKFAVIEEFLSSYKDLGKNPNLASHELGEVIHDFSIGDEKLEALRQLHGFVSDRENLASMIEAEFSYFDREDARKIVGI